MNELKNSEQIVVRIKNAGDRNLVVAVLAGNGYSVTFVQNKDLPEPESYFIVATLNH